MLHKKQILKTFASIVAVTLLTVFSSISAKGQLTVSKEAIVKASPATVWKMIGSFNHLDVWHPVVVDSTLNENGNVRILTLGDGAQITEKLIAHSDDGKSYTYAITESPLPVSDYVSTISVNKTADGSIVKWSSSFNASGAPDEKAVEIISGVYDAGLGSLSQHFNK